MSDAVRVPSARSDSGGFPPGPPRTLLSSLLYRPGRDPLAFFTNLARTYGDVAYVHMGGEHVFVVSDPALVRDVLVTNQRKFVKGRGLQRAKRLLGEGLLTSEGAVHVRQRRLIQPAFHRDRIAAYARVMTGYADRLRCQWRDGDTIDAAEAMMRLTLGIVGQTLFDADVESQARDVGEALTAVMDSFWLQMLPLFDVLDKLPIPAMRRSREARAKLDRIIYGMIAERRAAPGDRHDLLSMLINARDEENDLRGMSDLQVRDEAMTIFLAGHETTANALSWTWHLLSRAPEVEARLHEEIDRVLAKRVPTLADLPALGFVERVVTESMRLFPPAWIIGRRSIEPYSLAGYEVPVGSILVISPWILHRDQRFFPDPESFRPDRWTPEFKQSLPPFAYVPFGGGARRCIGESFAWMELVLVLATIAQRWRLEAVADHPVIPQPVVTLRMKHGLRVTLRQRTADA
ncbi:MAG TPA: cytochrome P450 [Vicinamibacterales bacterium]|nr:cytochrome P450 [Vicinamibacterales bacterium]